VSLFETIRGTIQNLFQISGTDGPQLKGAIGGGGDPILEARDATDVGYIIVRGDDPLIADDLVNKRYGDANYLGGGSVDTANTNWVAKDGSDITGTANRQDLPWLTIAPALAAAAAGDIVRVRSGTYTPAAGFTVPAGVALIGDDFLTTIIDGSALAAHVITLSTLGNSYLQNFRIDVPTAAGFAGITHSAFTASIYDLDLRGDGTTGVGDGIYKTGTGKIVGSNIRCDLGGLGAVCRVDSGTLALDAVHVPPATGAIADVILVEGTGRFQGQGINVGNPLVTDCLHVAGAGVALIYSPNWANATIGAHIAADGVTVTVIGGKIDPGVASILIDQALTGAGTTITVSGTTVQPLFSFPAAAITGMKLNATFHQEETATRDAESRAVGADFVTGFPELGSGISAGEGSAFSDGIKVVSTDGTETMVGSVVTGGTQTDVTAEAQSRSASALTFQGTGVGNAIYLATSRTDGTGTALKHWGALINQLVAGVDGSYVVEIWDGAAWVAVGVQATSQVETYRYSNALFLRAASNEFLQYGIDTDTTWGLATVDEAGTVIGPHYYVRWRIDTLVTTLPTFELAWLTPSFANFNNLGRRRALGLALWRKALIIGGNVFGESGGVVSGNHPIGTGGVPTGWTQNAPNSELDNSGNAIYTQLILPQGICTAFPLQLTVVYSTDGGQPVTLAPTGILSVFPAEVQGVEVADPAGGLVPTPRILANTEDLAGGGAKAGQVAGPTALTALTTTDNKALSTNFGDFDINGYYEGDLILIRFEMDNDGTPNQDITVWSIILNGVVFSDGGTL